MTRRPNVLLVVADQHRHDWIEGVHEDLPVRTPNLRRLQAAGMTFHNATTPSPLCAPARACLATGLDYDSSPVPNNSHDLPPEAATYYRELRDAGGYHVAGVGKFDLHKATKDWNLDGTRLLHDWGLCDGIDNEGKFDSLWSGRVAPQGPYMKYLYDEGLAAAHLTDFERRRHGLYSDVAPSPLPEPAYLDNWIAANAHSILDRCPDGSPWHVVVNFAGPHDPMDVTTRMAEEWESTEFPPPHRPSSFAGDHQETRRRYAAMVENIDRHLGVLLDRLENDGELQNTVVIYTSDHGEMLGDHGAWGKSISLDPSIRVPLVVSGPVVARPGGESSALISLEDIAATVLELAGLRTPGTMTARSFVPILRGETDVHREFTLSGLDRDAAQIQASLSHYGDSSWARLHRWRTVRTTDEKLTISDDLPGPVLIDLADDPWEDTNLAEARPESVARLAGFLEHRAPDFVPSAAGDLS